MAKFSAAPNHEILEAALQGLEAQKSKLDDQIAQVRSMLGRRAGRPVKVASAPGETESTAPAPVKGTRKKRVLSSEARKRIAIAQKKRWAAFRKGQE
ncbi:MAG TPA: hypothetical protein VK604_01165 [Bryobacteraceae bacterium]|nr:hypothetical protein [Bryobacteraceae bacterium]